LGNSCIVNTCDSQHYSKAFLGAARQDDDIKIL
jgi:hypothetical protein